MTSPDHPSEPTTDWRPPSADLIDPARPSLARAYSVLLGGKDFYEVDKAVVDALREVFDDPETLALTNRRWLTRVVRWLARDAGVSQFIDCGSGLPTDDNVHQIAQRYNMEAKVVYSDNDPTVQAHGRALLEENENTAFVGADLREPELLLSQEPVQRMIDFSEPVALIQCATLHSVPDEPQPPADIVARFMSALPSGSYLALTHAIYPPQDEDPDGRGHAIAEEIRRRVREKGLDTGYWRPYEQVLGFFDGLELVEPGFVRTHDWWPEGPAELADLERIIYGGVARKP